MLLVGKQKSQFFETNMPEAQTFRDNTFLRRASFQKDPIPQGGARNPKLAVLKMQKSMQTKTSAFIDKGTPAPVEGLRPQNPVPPARRPAVTRLCYQSREAAAADAAATASLVSGAAESRPRYLRRGQVKTGLWQKAAG